MPTDKELRTQQRERLYDFLKLLKDFQNGEGEKSLNEMIRRLCSIMDEEDVAYVEKKIAEGN